MKISEIKNLDELRSLRREKKRELKQIKQLMKVQLEQSPDAIVRAIDRDMQLPVMAIQAVQTGLRIFAAGSASERRGYAQTDEAAPTNWSTVAADVVEVALRAWQQQK